jgi:hypothetical protein
VGLGFARPLTDRFSFGVGVKMAIQDLGSAAMSVPDVGAVRPDLTIDLDETNPRDLRMRNIALDLGAIYRTGFRSLNFAIRVRNFAPEVMYVRESFELPLTFQTGVSMNLMDFTNLDQTMNSFVLSVDAERHRDYAEQLRIGGEYMLMNTLALRAGYAYPADEKGISLGAGLNVNVSGVGLSADYAYTQFGLFGGVNQLGIKLGL